MEGRALSILLLGLAAAGCSRPSAGKPCGTVSRVACSGPDRALACDPAGGDAGASVWVEVSCGGPAGCKAGGPKDVCDDSVAAEGDPCPPGAPGDYACTADHTRSLECRGGRFALWRRCLGPGGCVVEGGRNVRCDTTLGEVADPCGQAGSYACSVDHQAMLACDAGALVAASSCRGPEGCRVEAATRKVTCDDSLALAGDPCDLEGRIACSPDGGAELTCTDGGYARRRECRRTPCRLEKDELFCD